MVVCGDNVISGGKYNNLSSVSAQNNTVDNSTNESPYDDEYYSDKSSGRGGYNLSGMGITVADKM